MPNYGSFSRHSFNKRNGNPLDIGKIIGDPDEEVVHQDGEEQVNGVEAEGWSHRVELRNRGLGPWRQLSPRRGASLGNRNRCRWLRNSLDEKERGRIPAYEDSG